MTQTVASVAATTVAARGTKYSSANSPKLPPESKETADPIEAMWFGNRERGERQSGGKGEGFVQVAVHR